VGTNGSPAARGQPDTDVRSPARPGGRLPGAEQHQHQRSLRRPLPDPGGASGTAGSVTARVTHLPGVVHVPMLGRCSSSPTQMPSRSAPPSIRVGSSRPWSSCGGGFLASPTPCRRGPASGLSPAGSGCPYHCARQRGRVLAAIAPTDPTPPSAAASITYNAASDNEIARCRSCQVRRLMDCDRWVVASTGLLAVVIGP
jgi:hypothetical protein